jgi:hypothetical protein
MSEHSAENNLDCNDLLLKLLSSLIASSSIFWTSGAIDFEMMASLRRKQCEENNSRALMLGKCGESFQAS